MPASAENTKIETSLITIAIAVSLSALGLVWLIGIELLPLALLAIPLAGFAYWQTYVKPYLWVVILVVGTFLGNVIHLAEGGVVPLTLFQLALFVAVGSIILRRIVEQDFNFRYMGIEIEVVLFLSLIYLSLLWAPDPMGGFVDSTRLVISFFFIYIVFNELKRQEEMITLFVVTIAVATLLGFYALYQNVTNIDVAVENIMAEGTLIRGRAVGTSDDPNRFATMFFIPMAFAGCVILAKAKFYYKIMAFLGLAVMGGGLIVTYSRSAWVAAILMIIIIAWYYRNVKLFVYIGILGVIVLAAFPQLSITLINAAQRFLDITAGASDDSSRIRIILGIAAIGMFIDTYLLGVGFRGFPDRFTDYFSTQESIGVTEPHNITYTILAELGIIGIILFGLLFFKILRVAWLNIKLSETEIEKIIAVTTFSTIIAFLVFYQFYGGALNDNNLWLMAAITFCLYYSSANTSSSPLSKTAQRGDRNEAPESSRADKPPQ
ncbi:MAG: O-antigen ligase family protein [Balneolia bacterium]|nr:O-antigen ligase family protein [Balneolia bacterium]